jgi:hypothetical protein
MTTAVEEAEREIAAEERNMRWVRKINRDPALPAICVKVALAIAVAEMSTSIKVIADQCALSTDQVQDAIDELEGGGYLAVDSLPFPEITQ